MNGCVYRTADDQCEKFSDPVRNTLSWCVGDTPCEARKLSNADRIRKMSDEELAKKMSGLESFALTCGGGWSPEKWLEWLKKEVSNDS